MGDHFTPDTINHLMEHLIFYYENKLKNMTYKATLLLLMASTITHNCIHCVTQVKSNAPERITTLVLCSPKPQLINRLCLRSENM